MCAFIITLHLIIYKGIKSIYFDITSTFDKINFLFMTDKKSGFEIFADVYLSRTGKATHQCVSLADFTDGVKTTGERDDDGSRARVQYNSYWLSFDS